MRPWAERSFPVRTFGASAFYSTRPTTSCRAFWPYSTGQARTIFKSTCPRRHLSPVNWDLINASGLRPNSCRCASRRSSRQTSRPCGRLRPSCLCGRMRSPACASSGLPPSRSLIGSTPKSPMTARPLRVPPRPHGGRHGGILVRGAHRHPRRCARWVGDGSGRSGGRADAGTAFLARYASFGSADRPDTSCTFQQQAGRASSAAARCRRGAGAADDGVPPPGAYAVSSPAAGSGSPPVDETLTAPPSSEKDIDLVSGED